MKSNSTWLLIGAFVALMCLIGWTGHAQNRQPSKVVWEYKVVTLGDPETERPDWINNLGAQGWELIAVRDNHYYSGGNMSTSNMAVHYFKRAR